MDVPQALSAEGSRRLKEGKVGFRLHETVSKTLSSHRAQREDRRPIKEGTMRPGVKHPFSLLCPK